MLIQLANILLSILGTYIIIIFIENVFAYKLETNKKYLYIFLMTSLAVGNAYFGSSIQVNSIFKTLNLIFLFTVYILINKIILECNFKMALVITFSYTLAFLIGDNLAYLILIKILKFDIMEYGSNIILRTLSNLVCYLTVIIIVKIIQYLKNIELLNLIFNKNSRIIPKKTTVIYIGISLVWLLINTLMYFIYSDNINIAFFILNFIIIIAYLMINLSVLSMNIKLIEREKYINTIEQLSFDLRQFKHNYFNILHGINGYIGENDMVGLKSYFSEIVEDSKKVKNNYILELQKIKNVPLKGLISQKINEAREKGLNPSLRISDNIDIMNMKSSEICEVMGIFLDNAIESCMEAQEKIFNIDIYTIEGSIVITVENSFKRKPNIHRIYERGFTTKEGRDRGLGLYIAKNILSKHRVIHNNTIEKELFRQEVQILA